MRIIVISDTHGDYAALQRIINPNADADWIIHLGDGEKELDRYILNFPTMAPKIIHVAGNCDPNSLSPDVFTLPVMEHKILATHGHLYGVKSSLERLKMMARENECDIILFGHTHVPVERYEDGLYILNPGSASCPHEIGMKPTFGHIDISDAGVMLNIAEL